MRSPDLGGQVGLWRTFAASGREVKATSFDKKTVRTGQKGDSGDGAIYSERLRRIKPTHSWGNFEARW